jgi:tyrosine phenol-lyase
MLGDEAYAGSKSYYQLEEAIQKFYGYKYVIPTHQGRGAENILSKILVKKGDIIPGNMYFTTTRLHQELAGGTFHDIIVDEAHDPNSEFPFKGNVDLDKLEMLIKKYGAKKIPYIISEVFWPLMTGTYSKKPATWWWCMKDCIHMAAWPAATWRR